MATGAHGHCRCEPRTAIRVDPGVERDGLGAGDSCVLSGVVPSAAADGMLARLRSEVEWCVMRHKGGQVPRLVAMQASVAPNGVNNQQPINCSAACLKLVQMHGLCYILLDVARSKPAERHACSA